MNKQKNRPRETLALKLKKQMETFPFNPPKKLVEEGKWFLAVTSFEATNSVLNTVDENNSFSNSMPGHWSSEDGEEHINMLNKY